MAQQPSTNHNNKHVTAFAFPYGAHATPFLNLVVKLARAAPSAWFSFFTTPNSINNLSLFDIPPNLHFYDVVWDGIPDDHPLRHSPQLFSVVEMADLFLKAGPSNLEQALDLAISNTNRRVTCVIADAFVTPSLVLSQSLQVPWIAFWASNAYSLTSFFHAHLIRQHYCINNTQKYQTLSFIPAFSHFLIQDLPHNITHQETDEESIILKALASMGEVLPQAKAVVVNFYELDPPSLVQHLRSKLHSFIYAGFLSLSLPLPPLPPSHSDITGCLSWLDKQPPLSVAYISLGTLVTPPPHELVAIAEALDETKVPFLWSLKDQLRACLPHGFVERSSSMHGKIVPWAPQTMVLGHGSVGVFVTHGGNNSISESVSSSGVPMIFRPYFGDHMINARMVEVVWEIGVKIEDGVFTKEGLMRSLKLILEQEEGKVMREKAQALKKIVLEAAGPNGKVTQQLETLVELVLC